MIYHLIDEYKFFRNYPEEQLNLTGQLYGSIINEKLIQGKSFQICLEIVFECLNGQGGGQTHKLFNFGLIALEKFKLNIWQFPGYAVRLFMVPRLLHSYYKLLVEIKEIMERNNRPIDKEALRAFHLKEKQKQK